MIIPSLRLYLFMILPAAQFTGDLSSGTENAYNNIIWYDSRPKPSWTEIVNAYNSHLLSVAKRKKLEKLDGFYQAGKPLKLVSSNKYVDFTVEIYERFIGERLGLAEAGRVDFILGMYVSGSPPTTIEIVTIRLAGSTPNFFTRVCAPKADDDWSKRCFVMGHIFAINALQTVGEVERYDYTQEISWWGQTGSLTGAPLEIDITDIIISSDAY